MQKAVDEMSTAFLYLRLAQQTHSLIALQSRATSFAPLGAYIMLHYVEHIIHH